MFPNRPREFHDALLTTATLTGPIARPNATPVMAEPHGPSESPPRDRTPSVAGAIASAIACSDRFWIAAPVSVRERLLETLVAQLRDRGERVLVLTATPEAANRLAERFVHDGVVRALAPNEAVSDLPAILSSVVSTAVGAGRVEETRQRLNDMIRQANDAIDRANRTAETWDQLKAVRCSCSSPAIPADPARTLERDQASVELPVLRKELAELAPLVAAKRAGRLLSKAFWKATLNGDLMRKADELESRILVAERVLQSGDETPLPVKVSGESGEFRRLCDELRMEGVAPPDAPTPSALDAARQIADGNRQEAEATLSYARKTLADLESDPAAMAVQYVNRATLVVGPYASKRDSAIERGTFDRRILEGAESVTQTEWEVLASETDRTILVGDFAPHSDFPPSGSISESWATAHRPQWRREAGRLVAVVAAIVGEPRREPLADRSDIELRFGTDATGDYVLASVAFSPETGVADAKAFLALDLGEVQLVPLGPARWHSEELSVAWPLLESDDGVWIDVEPGVRERVVSVDGLPATAGVRFDSAMWSREAAEVWIDERSYVARQRRTAILANA